MTLLEEFENWKKSKPTVGRMLIPDHLYWHAASVMCVQRLKPTHEEVEAWLTELRLVSDVLLEMKGRTPCTRS